MKKRMLSLLLCLCILIGLFAAGAQAASYVPVTKIDTAGRTVLKVGETVHWSASAQPANATDKSLWWASGNPGVVTVNQNGYITAHKVGQSNITITAKNGFQKVILVTVSAINTAGKTTLAVGEKTRWTATVVPENTPNKSLYWAAGNPGVATVDQNGNITARKAGKCNISITEKNGVQKVILLTVKDTKPIAVTGIQTAGKTTIGIGERVRWTASALPANATDKSLWWAAGNPGVATVDQNGNITPHKAGKCNITVTAKNGVKKTVLLTVKTPEPLYRYLNKTVGDVWTAMGRDFSYDGYEGSTAMYNSNACFVLDHWTPSPSAADRIAYVISKDGTKLFEKLSGSMTYGEIKAAIGSEVSLKQPMYYYNAMYDVYEYSLDFIYRGYRVNYLWYDNPNLNKCSYGLASLKG